MNQTQALDIMKTGASVFLTGEPGSGKTHTVNQYVKYLRARDIEPAITASTGIAATQIGGITIHSWSGIGIRSALSRKELDKIAGNAYRREQIEEAGVLIIDEISMLDGQRLSSVNAVCQKVRRSRKPFGGLQVILVGDFFQLPPVTRQGEQVQYAFASAAWAQLQPVVLYLDEQHRQDDDDFVSVLAAIRSESFEEAHFSHLESRMVSGQEVPEEITRLYTHNVDVDAVNLRELEKLSGEQRSFPMSSSGPRELVDPLIKGCMSPENLVVKVGAAVMFTHNNFGAGYVNGTLGTVTGFHKETGNPLVRTQNRAGIEAEPVEWAIEENDEVKASITQIPLRLAWAITVHKSQGMSLDAAVMDLRRVFEFGQGYVALSRVRSLSGLFLLGINPQALLVHPEILARDQEFRGESEQVARRLGEISSEELKQSHNEFIESCDGELPYGTDD